MRAFNTAGTAGSSCSHSSRHFAPFSHSARTHPQSINTQGRRCSTMVLVSASSATAAPTAAAPRWVGKCQGTHHHINCRTHASPPCSIRVRRRREHARNKQPTLIWSCIPPLLFNISDTLVLPCSCVLSVVV